MDQNTIKLIRDALLMNAPPLNAELYMLGGAGPFVDKGMEGYVQGFWECVQLVESLIDKDEDGAEK